MNTQDVLIVGAFAAGAFLWLEKERQDKERVAALEAQNAALRAAAASKNKKKGTDWAAIAFGAIPVIGGVINALIGTKASS